MGTFFLLQGSLFYCRPFVLLVGARDIGRTKRVRKSTTHLPIFTACKFLTSRADRFLGLVHRTVARTFHGVI